MNVGGNSNGFAFDTSNNLWTGKYSYGSQQYLYMFEAANVATAITSGTALDVSNGTYDLRLKLPVQMTDGTYYL